jgi:hypothetical protein
VIRTYILYDSLLYQPIFNRLTLLSSDFMQLDFSIICLYGIEACFQRFWNGHTHCPSLTVFESDLISFQRRTEVIWGINHQCFLDLLLKIDSINWFNEPKSKLGAAFINQLITLSNYYCFLENKCLLEHPFLCFPIFSSWGSLCSNR